MSSLLERAIVDATALKEAALKNAENLVIEKYSDEVKDAVSQLLEQDELGLDMETPDAGMEDPLGLGGQKLQNQQKKLMKKLPQPKSLETAQ